MRYKTVLMCPDYTGEPQKDGKGNLVVVPRKQAFHLSKSGAETWAEAMLAGAAEGSYVDVSQMGWELVRRVDRDKKKD
jgi:hypothetical protein